MSEERIRWLLKSRWASRVNQRVSSHGKGLCNGKDGMLLRGRERARRGPRSQTVRVRVQAPGASPQSPFSCFLFCKIGNAGSTYTLVCQESEWVHRSTCDSLAHSQQLSFVWSCLIRKRGTGVGRKTGDEVNGKVSKMIFLVQPLE